MPSGATPNDVFTLPQVYGGACCSIPVLQEVIDALRDSFPLSRDEELQFIDDAFATTADHVWTKINSLLCTVVQ